MKTDYNTSTEPHLKAQVENKLGVVAECSGSCFPNVGVLLRMQLLPHTIQTNDIMSISSWWRDQQLLRTNGQKRDKSGAFGAFADECTIES